MRKVGAINEDDIENGRREIYWVDVITVELPREGEEVMGT